MVWFPLLAEELLTMREQDRQEDGIFSGRNMVVVYTMLSILVVMKKQLGLEAMLEYMDEYLRVAGEGNPRVRWAVRRALAMMSVEKMYHDAIHTKKKL